jgi:hypothetical protein
MLKKDPEVDDFPSRRITLPPFPPALFNVIFQGSGGSSSDGVTVLIIGTLIKRDENEKLKAIGVSVDPLNRKKSCPSSIFESESDVNLRTLLDPSFANPKGIIFLAPAGYVIPSELTILKSIVLPDPIGPAEPLLL